MKDYTLAKIAYETYYKAAGIRPTDWERVSAESKDIWYETAEAVLVSGMLRLFGTK